MIQVLTTIIPVLLMLGIGNLCCTIQVFTREGIDNLKKFAVNVCLSAVMINAFATMEYSLMNVVLAVIMFAICVLSWYLGRLASRIFGDSRYLPFLTSGFEAGMLGYAFYTMLYGTEHISQFAKLDLGQVLFVFTFYKIMLGMEGGGEKKSGKALLKEMISSSTIQATLVGMIIGLTGIHRIETVGILMDACTDFISAPTAAVILLTIGYDLVPGQIPWLRAGRSIAYRLVILAAVRIFLGFLLPAMGQSPELLKALNVMLILPPPFVSSVFCREEDQQAYLASALTMSTVVSVAGFVVLAAASNI